MNDFFEKLKAAGQEVRFEPERKQRIRNRLVQVMHERPVVVRQWWSMRWVQIATACLVFVIAGGASSAYAANQALPGDILYPIKIHINEPIAGAFKSTPQQKAEFEIQRASTRLEEVDQLALNQKLDSKTRESTEKNFNRQVDRAQKKIDEIGDSGDTGAAAELDSGLTAVLNAHEKVLDSLQQRPSSNHEELNQVQNNVRATLKRGNRSHSDKNQSPDQPVGAVQIPVVSGNSQISNSPSKLKSEAEDILRRSIDVFNSVPDSIRQDSSDLRNAAQQLAQARESYDKGDYEKTIFLAKNVLLVVQENNVLDGVNSRLKLDVRVRTEDKD